MKRHPLCAAILFSALSIAARAADTVSFSTFVAGSSIAGVEGGNHSTIAFNYAQNKFVGSVYYDNQLYSTDLERWQCRHIRRPASGILGLGR